MTKDKRMPGGLTRVLEGFAADLRMCGSEQQPSVCWFVRPVVNVLLETDIEHNYPPDKLCALLLDSPIPAGPGSMTG
jgi:hypothetical protein